VHGEGNPIPTAYVPAAQGVQAEAPEGLTLPALHLMHAALVVTPVLPLYVPAMQAVQVERLSAAVAALHVPAWHAEHPSTLLDPPCLMPKNPMPQSWHTAALEAAAVSLYLSWAHLVHPALDDAPAVNPYVPVGQFWHVDSAFAAPVPLPNFPATQLVQTVIPLLAEYEPTLYGWHLLVVVASAVQKYPGLQKYVQEGFAPETSALESAGGGQVVVRHVAEAPVPDTA
jgi:hypothetical protein